MIDGFHAADYQVHSYCSHDGRASIAEQCNRALALGLDEIGFSEHKDFDPDDPVVDYFDYDRYMREIGEAREAFGGALQIRAGVEIDYQAWFEDRIAQYLETHAFDFVIGSVHYVDRVMIMTPEYNRARTRRDAYRDYFTAVRDSVASDLFDVIGHLEYANRRGIASWGSYDPDEFGEDLQAIFAVALETETILEINTAGLHQGVGITYPTRRTVAIYAAAGGREVSIGSDAHHPDQLGYACPEAVRIARSAGMESVCGWSDRRRTCVPLD